MGWLADMESDGTRERGMGNHITITNGGELLRIYMNGEFDKEDPPGLKWGNEQKTLNTVLGIGKIGALWNGNEAEEAFTFGVIDEVSVYDRTLSADEVKQNYDTDTQAATAVDSAGKVALIRGGIKLSR